MAPREAGPRLSPSMTLTEFDNGYWYATELRAFARALGVARVGGLRKDELEREITARLRGGACQPVLRRRSTPRPCPEASDPELGLTLDRKIVHYVSNRETKAFLEREATKLSPGMRRRPGARYRLNRWR